MGGCGVGRLGAFVALDVRRTQPALGQQFIQHHTGAAAQGAVDEAGAPLFQVRQGLQAQRVAPGHHQALRALGKTNDLVQARL